MLKELKVKRAINGDEKAFIELIEKQREKLYRVAYAYVKNEEDALDIVQETVYKAYISIDTLRKPKYFNTWLTKILINISLATLKKNKNIIYLDEEILTHKPAPLTNIQTHLEAIIDGVWQPTTERLNSVNEEVVRLTSLVNQLKNLAKFDSEKSMLNLSIVDLGELIKNIIYNTQGSALDKNINIEDDIENIITYLDKEKISQLIVNLLSNAIRYTNENGYIYVKTYIDNNSIKIHIKDNGIGIPKNDLKYIFERFYRVDESRSKKTGGVGVGLTIAKSIVDLHKGTIEVKSEANKGSEFIVKLPLNRV